MLAGTRKMDFTDWKRHNSMETLADQIKPLIGEKKDTLVVSVKPDADWIAQRLSDALSDARVIEWSDFEDFKKQNVKEFLESVTGEGSPFENFIFVADKTEHYDNRFFEISHFVGETLKENFKDKVKIWVSMSNNQKEWKGWYDAVLCVHMMLDKMREA